jgi:hypothetical protein
MMESVLMVNAFIIHARHGNEMKSDAKKREGTRKEKGETIEALALRL